MPSARILWSPRHFANKFVVPKEGPLALGGLTPFTTIDYPGHLAAVLYTQGCPWSCLYCHNGHLQSPTGKPEGSLTWEAAIRFLKSREHLLEAVVFCGGEPTFHSELPEAMEEVRALGFKVGLHTSGMFPEKLKKALLHCDWVGMDVKAPFEKYDKITQVPSSGYKPEHSIDLILASSVSYEFRTTVHPELLSEEDILSIAKDLKSRGAKRYVIQAFRPEGCVQERLREGARLTETISEALRQTLSATFESFEVRE